MMVTEAFYPVVGGSETAIRYLSDTFSDMGHEVLVAVMNVKDASSDSTKFAFKKISPRVFGLNLRTYGKIYNVNKIVKEFRPDIINAHFLFESGFVGTAAAHRNGVASLVSIRGRGIFCKPRNALQKFLFKWWINGALQADGYLATSQEMADIAHERYGISPVALSNGVDVHLFHPSKKKDIKRKYGVRPEQKIIFCARRFVPKNGIEYMIRALPLIRKNTDAVLYFAAPFSGEYERYKALVEELGLQECVRFLGSLPHDELPYYFASADVVVQPSIAEARSLACLEAMASGAAIIATNTGGLKELIEHQKSGYLIPAFEESTYQVGAISEEGLRNLAGAVEEIFSNERLATTLQKGARASAEQYSWERICTQTLMLYEDARKAFQSRQS